MKITIIIDHPWEESFNHALLDTLIANLVKDKIDYQLIDLYKDGFNPVMEKKDLSTYKEGTSSDPLVNKYISMIKNTNKLVIIFPIWWYSCPAGFKGFMDKVFLDGVAFHDDGSGLKPLLDIQSTTLFTTSEQPTEGLLQRCNNAFEGQIITTLIDIGIRDVRWHNLGAISSLEAEERQDFIANAYKKIK